MRKTAIILFGLAAVTATMATVACGEKSRQVPGVIAHRGFWNTGASAQNSISSLRGAIGAGCFGVEFDVHVTADGIPVLFHDNETQSGIGIQDVTCDSLMAGAEKLANGERIPTLAEYLAAWDHAPCKLILELKTHRDAEQDDRAAGVVLECLHEFGVKPSEIEYIAFSRHAVKAFADRRCGSPIAYLNGDLTPAEANEQLGATGIDYNAGVLKEHPGWIAQAHEIGMTVNVWTVNTEDDMRRFINAGIDYITTDRPDILAAMLTAAEDVRRTEVF